MCLMNEEQNLEEENFTLKEFIDIVYVDIPIADSSAQSIYEIGHKKSKLFHPTTIRGKVIRVNQTKNEEYARQVVCRHCKSIFILKNDWVFHEKATKKSLRIIKDSMHLSEMERRKAVGKSNEQILGFKFKCDCRAQEKDCFVTNPILFNFQEIDI